MAAGEFVWPKPIDGLSANLEAVDELLLDSVGKSALGQAAAALITAGGKRLRPALVLAAASISGRKIVDKSIRTAAAIELIHLASIVHDDILDKSTLRRGKQTTASAQGPGFALLLGDYLLAKALFTAASADSLIARQLAETIAAMARGESFELADNDTIMPLTDKYINQARLKTAGLFGAAASAGALISELPPENVRTLQKYGEYFGLSFQLVDDIHDSKIDKDQIAQALRMIDKYNAAAEKCLEGLKGAAADSLRSLPSAYLAWALPR